MSGSVCSELGWRRQPAHRPGLRQVDKHRLVAGAVAGAGEQRDANQPGEGHDVLLRLDRERPSVWPTRPGSAASQCQ